MSKHGEDDPFEVRPGTARSRKSHSGAPPRFPTTKRARAEFFSRPRGAPKVSLARSADVAQRRVIIKARVVRSNVMIGGGGGAGGRSGGGLAVHVAYVERDGVSRDGAAGAFFDARDDEADAHSFAARCANDRHHFRIIMAPEDGVDLDLKDYTRTLMERAERDLKTRLDWVAGEHHDTGRPHVHLLIRGVRDDGRDLVIPPAYISHGLRDEACGLATEILGPRLERGPSRSIDRTASAERVTGLDNTLAERAQGQDVSAPDLLAAREHRLLQRLIKLEELGMAQRVGAEHWRLQPDFRGQLARLGETRAGEQALHRILARDDRGPEPARTIAFEAAHDVGRIAGRVVGVEPVARAPAGAHLVALEGVDGRLWIARVERLEALRAIDGAPAGAIIAFERQDAGLRPSDRTIWHIARDNEGLYSRDIHRAAIPGDREAYIDTMERRLEALRQSGISERLPDGTWVLPANFEARVLAHEQRRGAERTSVSLIDPHPLDRQRGHEGPTWLDRFVVGDLPHTDLAQSGFGGEVRAALRDRSPYLERADLLERRDGQVFVSRDMRDVLAGWERETLRKDLERETGKVAHFARDGEEIGGTYLGKRHAGERTHALIENDRTLTLAPWRPEMDRARNQFVYGRLEKGQLSFSYGQQAWERHHEQVQKLARGLSKGLGLSR